MKPRASGTGSEADILAASPAKNFGVLSQRTCVSNESCTASSKFMVKRPKLVRSFLSQTKSILRFCAIFPKNRFFLSLPAKQNKRQYVFAPHIAIFSIWQESQSSSRHTTAHGISHRCSIPSSRKSAGPTSSLPSTTVQAIPLPKYCAITPPNCPSAWRFYRTTRATGRHSPRHSKSHARNFPPTTLSRLPTRTTSGFRRNYACSKTPSRTARTRHRSSWAMPK